MKANKQMSDALTTIEKCFRDFRDGVERCRSSKSEGGFSAPDWVDAYERLYRLLNRYDFEKGKGRLDKPERAALSKAFENDAFIQDLMSYRVVGSHIQSEVAQKHGSLKIRDIRGAPISLVAETSAAAMFAASVITIDTIQGRPHTIDHLTNLEEAERRIAAAFDKLSV